MLQSNFILSLTFVGSINHVSEYGGISQMLKKLDYSTHEIFLEKTNFILYYKCLTICVSIILAFPHATIYLLSFEYHHNFGYFDVYWFPWTKAQSLQGFLFARIKIRFLNENGYKRSFLTNLKTFITI